MGGSKWEWVKVLLIFVLLESNWSEGCLEQERVALLALKNFFDDPNSLQNWVADENSDCCRWQGVKCNNNTCRVIKLDLWSTRIRGSGEWYLNASLFMPFQELESLNLGDNNIAGCVETEGLERLSKLSNLKVLNLAFNSFNKSILSSLNDLSSLRELHLLFNRLTGTIDLKELDSLSNLELLDIGFSAIDQLLIPTDPRGLRKLNTLYIEGIGTTDGNNLLQFIGSFPFLKILNLAYNRFTGTKINRELHNLTNLEDLTLDDSFFHVSLLQSIAVSTSLKRLSMRNYQGFRGTYGTALDKNFLQVIKSMTSLKFLSLSNSRLNGTILDQGLCELVHLQELHVDHNNLSGILPWCLANMTSLQVLNISSNQLTGNISSSPLKHLKSIQELKLSNNYFQIPISLGPFYNHSNLKIFNGENNLIYAQTESHSLTPKFQLNSIVLSHGSGVTFPKFLYHQHDLKHVNLSHINLRGEFPNWLLENNTKLQTLVLVNNSLSGTFQMPKHAHRHLTHLDVSENFFQGHIPGEIGVYLPSLNSLNFSFNSFNSSIPSSFGNMKSLSVLDLSNNQLIGEIPERLAMGCFSLRFLVLSNNKMQGHIFSKKFNLTNLWRLQLDGNHFIGEIPESLSNCNSLGGLYFSDNHLSGKIPRWLGNLSVLEDFIMPNNHLEGPIPMEFCQLNFLQILDISNNNIFGSLPSCFNPLSIKQVHLSKNMLQGQLTYGTFYNSSSLVTLDLSYNHFNDSIPSWIDRLSQLSYLILANNHLEGEVPIQLCRLKQLRLIDLSHNNLSGQIPSCLDNTSFHKDYRNASDPIFSPSPTFQIPSIYTGDSMGKEETITFTTKERSYSYQGKPLNSMSGLDLSCNKLTGEIPLRIGNLTRIHTLNVSHNKLMGLIPSTFSNLKQIESLDLSYNKLTGKIPPQLVELNALAVFSVAHNNLSGKTPDWVAQFATFNGSSYDGNPFLCGLPLPNICNKNGSSKASSCNGEDDSLIDMNSFYITFAVSYVIVFLGIVGVLYVNPYWRRRWFYFVESWMTTCYYFALNNVIPRRLYGGYM